MSLFVDKKYINLISCHFDKFKWKSDKLANCRCKFCGDSTTNKSKARGYFYVKNNKFFYKCHNCNIGYSLYTIINEVSPSLCKEYNAENFIEKNVFRKEPVHIEIPEPVDVKQQLNIIPIIELESSHKARKFIEDRKIPQSHWKNIGFAKNFAKIAEQFDENYKNRFIEEERIVILIKSNMGICAIQGRSFSNNRMKYITLKKENRSCFYNYDSVDTTKTFYVLEGPIDSMFIQNSIATLGMSGFRTLEEKIDDTNAIYVIDNQPYNKEVVDTIDYLIEKGKRVCIFPQEIKEKDINDMVLANLNPSDIIDDHIYSGLEAKLVFNNWKKYAKQ
jgi:hypothetical protein